MDYSSVLSKRVTSIKPSGIRRFFDLAEEMKDVISLGVGEPDFKTPYAIREEGIRTLERGSTWYTSNSGLLALRTEIAAYANRKFGLSYDPKKEILVTVGGSEAIDGALRALIDPGDEVLIPEPSFVAYSPLAELAGGQPVPIVTKEEDQFKLTAKALREKITPRSKVLILPFPNNPTGAVLRRGELEAIAKVLKDTGIVVISDEIYSELTYGEPHVSFASMEGMRERTVVISGFSKAFAMTGWRLGYAMAPEPILSQMLKIHQFAIMCSPTTSQYAAIEALRCCDDEVKAMTEEYDTRRRLLVSELRRIGLPCFSPEGAFYVFPSIQKTGMTSEEFCQKLLTQEKVAVIPGTAFGDCGEGFIRISYAYSLNHLLQAIKRIEKFLQKL